MEREIIQKLKDCGEKDGDIRRIYLNLGGTCKISDEFTDVVCAHLQGDKLTFQVNSPDDKYTVFATLDEFSEDAAKTIYLAVMSTK